MHRNKRTGGLSRTPVGFVWREMIERCYNPKGPQYSDYGGRGITVCERWFNSLPNFMEDMGERPSGYTLERVDNNGNYCPDNCRWATRLEQANNKRDNHKVTIDGVELTIAQWARKLGVTSELIRNRLYRGWTERDAILMPYQETAERNKANGKKLTYNGVTATVQEWADKLGVGRHLIDVRLKRGWSTDDALSLKPDRGRKRLPTA